MGFSVTQKDGVILSLFKRHLKCGSLKERKNGVVYYEVTNFNSIVGNVIPFFKKFGFLSARKKNDFAKFVAIATLIEEKKHLSEQGIKQILFIRKGLLRNPRNSDDVILDELQNIKESSETIRKNIGG